MDLGLTGRRALVLAASEGLGRGIAAALAAEGARLMIASRRGDAIARTAGEIAAAHDADVVGRACDLARAEEASALASAALAHFGGIDILVGNCGGPPPGRISAVSQEDWQTWFGTLFLNLVAMTGQALPGMRERRWGRILVVTSLAVKQPIPHLGISNALRAAVTGWARTLADEVGPDGVTVNTILPGRIATARLVRNLRHEAEAAGATVAEQEAKAVAAVPLRRPGTPQDFGAVAAFLCSDRAGYITGAAIPVDGGAARSLF